jgi:hypothetical protein
MDFGGDEIYTPELPQLTGKKYGETLNLFKKNCVMGLVTNGTAALNPPMDTVIQAGDRVVVIAEDDDKIFIDGAPEIDEKAFSKPVKLTAKPERTILLGWNWRAPLLLCELDNYVAAGSEAVVVGDIDGLEGDEGEERPEAPEAELQIRQDHRARAARKPGPVQVRPHHPAVLLR